MASQREYDKLFMGFAHDVSKLSKCVSIHVGAVLVKDNRVISHGVNGTRPGHINCCERFPAYNAETSRPAHSAWSQKHEWHAEANAISFALKQKQDVEGSTLYVTLAPCFECMKSFIGLFGVSRVVYTDVYDRCNIQDVQDQADVYSVTLEKYHED